MARSVLAVDDDALILELHIEMLESIGCDVTPALSGTDALAALDRDPRIELLITDIQMPSMDGYELARRAQQIRPRLQVLVITGKTDDGHGYPIISKPLMRSELIAVMSRTVGLC